MKLNVDYKLIHSAIRNIKLGYNLTNEEKNVLLQLAIETEGDYYPSQWQLEQQEYRVKCLTEELFERNPQRYGEILNDCKDFENKFC